MLYIGAGKGIGQAAAMLLSSQGAAILVCDLDSGAAEQVAREIRVAGGRAAAVAEDVTSHDAPQRIVEAAVSSFGGIDVL